MKKNIIWVSAIVVFILALDQVLKIWVKSTFSYYDGPVNLAGDWLRMRYVENRGMAFGTTFGASIYAKLGLSIFRVFAIIGIAFYWVQQAKRQAKLEFLIALGLIFAGATGNLIDSMFYDFIFVFDPCLDFNQSLGSGVFSKCYDDVVETRHTGFLLGNVVDMFQFNFTWPTWVPYLGGGEVFPAIWNIADASISGGVILILLRQKTFFPKENTKSESSTQEVEEKEIVE